MSVNLIVPLPIEVILTAAQKSDPSKKADARATIGKAVVEGIKALYHDLERRETEAGKEADNVNIGSSKSVDPTSVGRPSKRIKREHGKPTLSPPVNIIVVDARDRCETYQLAKSDTIDALKTRIRDRTGVPSDRQRLLYAGRELWCRETIEHHNIPDGALVLFAQRPGDS